MSTRHARVLVVDDNEDHRYLTRMALRDSDGVVVDVAEARDGEDALAYLYGRPPYESRELPNLVLLDLRMPRVDGIEVTERVKQDPELRHIPIVVLTSSSRPEDVAAAYDRGANNYVTKESFDELRSLAHHWTRASRLPADS